MLAVTRRSLLLAAAAAPFVARAQSWPSGIIRIVAPFPPGGPDELRQFFEDQMRVWGAVVRDNGIKSDS
jgi:tripartite-type tricarboxylate transporter receptor subunit TctC